MIKEILLVSALLALPPLGTEVQQEVQEMDETAGWAEEGPADVLFSATDLYAIYVIDLCGGPSETSVPEAILWADDEVFIVPQSHGAVFYQVEGHGLGGVVLDEGALGDLLKRVPCCTCTAPWHLNCKEYDRPCCCIFESDGTWGGTKCSCTSGTCDPQQILSVAPSSDLVVA